MNHISRYESQWQSWYLSVLAGLPYSSPKYFVSGVASRSAPIVKYYAPPAYARCEGYGCRVRAELILQKVKRLCTLNRKAALRQLPEGNLGW